MIIESLKVGGAEKTLKKLKDPILQPCKCVCFVFTILTQRESVLLTMFQWKVYGIDLKRSQAILGCPCCGIKP